MPQTSFDAHKLTRPDRALLTYYTVVSLFTGPLFPVVFLPLYFRYHTMRYTFDESGVTMSWGFLFRHETQLTYRRIQDIHLVRGLLQRWFGLANLAIQTASGSAGAEMTIEGVLAFEQLRDYLYTKMRGARPEAMSHEAAAPDAVAGDDEALALLHEIRDLLAERQRREGVPS